MIIENLEGAACSGQPELFDPDTHRHLYLGAGNDCWICDEARDLCIECPVIEACFRQGQQQRESHMIRAGFAWTNGRPRDLRKRRR